MSDKDLYFNETMLDEELDDYILHYGMPRRSGRYPWGSGDNPYQHDGDFLSRVQELKEKGMSEKEIADALGMSTTQLRVQKSLANDERRAVLVEQAKDLKAKGYNPYQIAEKMGFKNESSVRSLLNESSEHRMNEAKTTADFLRKQIEEKGFIDVGKGVEKELGITSVKLKEALTILEMEGYPIYKAGVPQVTNPGKQSNMLIIGPKDSEYKDVYNDGSFDKVHSVREYISHDGGETFDPKWVYPKSMDSSRLAINYAEDGGDQKDGVVEIRRGVDDLSLGNSHYAQVRILVDGTHYIKGMAVYSDDLPEGIDVRFNTNKKKGTPQTEVLKKIKDDPDNPFGSLIKEGINDPDKGDEFKGGQSYYYDKDGKKQLSLINKRAEEGDWEDWSKKLPSQFLAKQPLSLAKKQLKISEADKELEYKQISELTNPTLKANLLNSFADDCDTKD